MRKLLQNVKRNLSLLLVAAMLFGAIPQNAIVSSAAEVKTPGETQTLTEAQTEVPGVELLEEGQNTEYEVTLPATDEKITVSGNGKTVSGADYSFTVEAKEGFEIKEVKYVIEGGSEEVLTAGADGKTYTISAEKVTANITVSVVAEAKAEEPIITEHEITLPSTDEKITVSGNNKTVSGADYSFTVEAKEGFEVKEVKYTVKGGSEEALTAGADGKTYTIPAEKVTANITVSVVAEAKAEEPVITEYEVTLPATDEKITVSGNNKTVSGADYTFTVEAKEGFEIKEVKYAIEGGSEEVLTAGADGKTYTISAEKVTANITVVVTVEANIPREVPSGIALHVVTDRGTSAIKAVLDGKYIQHDTSQGKEDNTTQVTYYVPEGSVVTFTPVIAGERYEFAKATTVQGAKSKAEKVKAAGFSYTVTATAETTTTIETRGVYTIDLTRIVIEGTDYLVEGKKGTYITESGKEYQLGIYKGDERLTLKSLAITGGVGERTKANIINDESGNPVVGSITIDAADAGKKLKVKASVEGKDYSLTFDVKPLLEKVKVNGKDKLSVAVPVKNAVEYPMSLVPANVSEVFWTGLRAESSDTSIVSAFITSEDKLRIEVNTKEVNKTATVKIKIDDTEFATVTVTTKENPIQSVTPIVKVVSSDAHGFDLSIKTAKVGEPAGGKYFYKITTTELPDAGGMELEYPAELRYVPYEEAVETVRVTTYQDDGLGSATPRKYRVKVELLLTDGTELNTEADETENTIIFRSKVKTLNNVFIKAYYYEDNLKLKTVNKTVYRGQRGVLIATPVFGKNTTVKKISNVYLSSGVQEFITVYVGENGNIYADIAENAHVGNYYEVTAVPEAPVNTRTKSVSIKLNVAYGIGDLQVIAPKEVYKVPKKAATFTPQVAYNFGLVNEQPKNKKVEWKILNQQGEEVTDKSVTIKNGKVTIAKDYILTGNDRYTIEVTAADYPGNEVVGRGEFTITNKPAQLGEAVIANYNYDYDYDRSTYTVVARSGGRIEADDLDYKMLVVLKPGVEKKEVYMEEDIISSQDHAFAYSTSNKKAIFMYSDGTIDSMGCAKNVKITATSTDGSKAKAVLSNLTIDYAGGHNLSLYIEEYGHPSKTNWGQQTGEKTDYAETEELASKTPIKYEGGKETVFAVRLVDLEDAENWQLSFTNHKLAVKGGKILSQDPTNGTYYILANAGTTTLTLTDKAINKNKVYVLQNVNAATDKAPKVTQKSELVEASRGTDVVYSVKFPTGVSYEAVYVTLDESKFLTDGTYMYLDGTGKDSLGTPLEIGKDGTVVLRFATNDHYYIDSGNYKLNFIFGNMEKESEDSEPVFVAKTKPSSATLKVSELRIPKVKPAKLTTSYNLNFKETDQVELTLSNKKHEILEVGMVQSLNVKGQSNYFADLFGVDTINIPGTDGGESTFKYVIKAKNEFREAGKKYSGLISYIRCRDENGNVYWLYGVQINITLKDTSTV